MNRDFEVHGIKFHIGNYTPRRNEFERGAKYKLYVYRDLKHEGETAIPTNFICSTIKEAKEFATREWIRFDY